MALKVFTVPCVFFAVVNLYVIGWRCFHLAEMIVMLP